MSSEDTEVRTVADVEENWRELYRAMAIGAEVASWDGGGDSGHVAVESVVPMVLHEWVEEIVYKALGSPSWNGYPDCCGSAYLSEAGIKLTGSEDYGYEPMGDEPTVDVPPIPKSVCRVLRGLRLSYSSDPARQRSSATDARGFSATYVTDAAEVRIDVTYEDGYAPVAATAEWAEAAAKEIGGVAAAYQPAEGYIEQSTVWDHETLAASTESDGRLPWALTIFDKRVEGVGAVIDAPDEVLAELVAGRVAGGTIAAPAPRVSYATSTDSEEGVGQDAELGRGDAGGDFFGDVIESSVTFLGPDTECSFRGSLCSFQQFAQFLRTTAADPEAAFAAFPELHKPENEALRSRLRDAWDITQPLTVNDVVTSPQHVRAAAFSCFTAEKLFSQLPKKLVSTYTATWPVETPVGEAPRQVHPSTYELYEVSATSLGTSVAGFGNNVYALRCWCPSTAAEHWLFVPRPGHYLDESQRALAALVSTLPPAVKNLRAIRRQGDLWLLETDGKPQYATLYSSAVAMPRDEFAARLVSDN